MTYLVILASPVGHLTFGAISGISRQAFNKSTPAAAWIAKSTAVQRN